MMVTQKPRLYAAILLHILKASITSMGSVLTCGTLQTDQAQDNQDAKQADMDVGTALEVVQVQKIPKQHVAYLRQAILDDSLWDSLPPEACTEFFVCLSFRLYSRSGGAAYLYVQSHHERPLARMLKAVGLAPETRDSELHSLGALSQCQSEFVVWQHFQVDYPGRPACKESVAVLETVDSMLKVTVAEVECRHAAIRRMVLARSHGWNRSFGFVGSMFGFMRMRGRHNNWKQRLINKVVSENRSPREGPSVKKTGCSKQMKASTSKKSIADRVRKAAGSWGYKVFVREQLTGHAGLPDAETTRQVGEQWRALSDVAREDFVRRGAILEQAHLFTQDGSRLPLCQRVRFNASDAPAVGGEVVAIAGGDIVAIPHFDDVEHNVPALLDQRLEVLAGDVQAASELATRQSEERRSKRLAESQAVLAWDAFKSPCGDGDGYRKVVCFHQQGLSNSHEFAYLLFGFHVSFLCVMP